MCTVYWQINLLDVRFIDVLSVSISILLQKKETALIEMDIKNNLAMHPMHGHKAMQLVKDTNIQHW